MPELPEVETVVRDLRPLLVNHKIAGVEVGDLTLRRPWQVDWNAAVIGSRIKEIRRRGKWIDVVLSKDRHLLFHLGMTGQMRVLPRAEPCADHTHFILDLDRGKQFRFRDVRRFGSAAFYPSTVALEQFFAAARLGPEPFDLTADYLRQRLRATKRCLKAILLDQQVVAGVGNIYADEALFAARLHPQRLGRQVTSPQARRLREAVAAVLKTAIESRGSSIRNYIGGSGLKGNYQNEFAVYGRTGQPCRRCRAEIERIRLAGRSTHFCPKCQKKG